MFSCANAEEFHKHMISPDLYSLFDHTSLSVNIIIEEKSIYNKRQTIVKNSIEEEKFVNKLKNRIGHTNIANILDYKMLERII